MVKKQKDWKVWGFPLAAFVIGILVGMYGMPNYFPETGLTSTQQASAGIYTSVIGAYAYDGAPGSENDYSPSGNDFSWTEGTQVPSPFGTGNAVEDLRADVDAVVDATNGLTVSFWVQPKDNSQGAIWYARQSSGKTDVLNYILINNGIHPNTGQPRGRVEFTFSTGGVDQCRYISREGFVKQTGSYVTVTWDGHLNCAVYVDGVYVPPLVDYTSGNPVGTSFRGYSFGIYDSSWMPFNGITDETLIMQKYVTAGEATQLFQDATVRVSEKDLTDPVLAKTTGVPFIIWASAASNEPADPLVDKGPTWCNAGVYGVDYCCDVAQNTGNPKIVDATGGLAGGVYCKTVGN